MNVERQNWKCENAKPQPIIRDFDELAHDVHDQNRWETIIQMVNIVGAQRKYL